MLLSTLPAQLCFPEILLPKLELLVSNNIGSSRPTREVVEFH